jgi:hypothetical protein
MNPISQMADKRRANRDRAARLLAARAEALRIVASGVCPHCGAKLRRNLALTGWWQCEQVGAPGFRADNEKPQCTGQWFTE